MTMTNKTTTQRTNGRTEKKTDKTERKYFYVVGRVSKDIELEKTKTGKLVANFSICENLLINYSQAVPRFTKTEAWESVAKSIYQNLEKGDLVEFKVESVNSSFVNGNGKQIEHWYFRVKSYDLLKRAKRKNTNKNNYEHFRNESSDTTTKAIAA